jgi:hypothetical protein
MILPSAALLRFASVVLNWRCTSATSPSDMRRRARAREGPVFRKCCAGAPRVDERLDYSMTPDAAEHRNFHWYQHLLGVLFGLMHATANRVLISRKTTKLGRALIRSHHLARRPSRLTRRPPSGASREAATTGAAWRSAKLTVDPASQSSSHINSANADRQTSAFGVGDLRGGFRGWCLWLPARPQCGRRNQGSAPADLSGLHRCH